MAISKVILNEDVLMDVTDDTVTANNLLGDIQATGADGEKVIGTIGTNTSSNLSVSGATVTAPAGYYAESASKSVATTSHPAPTASINKTTGVVTASHTQGTGYVIGGTTTGTLNLSTQAAKTVTPTEQEQTAVAADKYTTGAVKVGAISSTYVGSGIPQNDSSDLTASGATVTAPAGYYAEAATKSVATATHPKPTATINSSTGVVTASHTQSTGYVTGGTTTNTLSLSTQSGKTVAPTEAEQVAVEANKYTTGEVKVGAISSTYVGSDVAKRSSSNLTASGATVTAPAGYYESAATKTIASGSATTPATTITAQPTIELNVATGVVTATNNKTQNITPTVTAGYVSAGTAGTITVSGGDTLQLATQAGSTVTPSKTESVVVETAGKYMTGNVTVSPLQINLQEKTVDPTNEVQVIIPEDETLATLYLHDDDIAYAKPLTVSYKQGSLSSVTQGETVTIDGQLHYDTGSGQLALFADLSRSFVWDGQSYSFTVSKIGINVTVTINADSVVFNTTSQVTVTASNNTDSTMNIYLKRVAEGFSKVTVNAMPKNLVDMSWSKIKECVNEGVDPSFLPIGTQITDKWTWQGTTYDAPWNVVHYDSEGMYLQWRDVIPFSLPYDEKEAIFAVGENGLEAGTYNIAIKYKFGKWVQDTAIQFTLTQACDPGDQFVYHGYTANNDTIYVYSFGSKNEKQRAATTNGTDGIQIGSTATSDTSLGSSNEYGKVNRLIGVDYGYGNWAQSAIRQWLNSDEEAGAWWTPQNPWDRPPSYVDTLPGFLSGYTEEFKSMLETVNVNGCNDKIFMLRGHNYWFTRDNSDYPIYDYYSDEFKEDKDTLYYPKLIKNKLGTNNAVEYIMNGPFGNSIFPYRIKTDGRINFNSGDKYSPFGLEVGYCPACVVKKNTPSYLTMSNLDWTAIKKMATLDTGSSLDIGTQIVDTWTRSDNGTAIQVPWDIVHYDDKNMVLQWHYTLPFATFFDEDEALYYVGEDGLAAGTYYITTTNLTGVAALNDINIQFTLLSACDPGDQFVISTSSGFDIANGKTLTVYGYGSTIEKQTAITSSGTDGILLGTLGDKSAINGNCNGAYSFSFGNHRWSTSNLRQWLNSDSAAGEWWRPTTPWDRPPSYVNYSGFLYGMSEDFKNAITVSENKTLLDTVSGFTDAYETTYDKIYLPSVEELYTQPDIYGIEGEPWMYYRQQAKNAGLNGYMSQSATAANNIRIKYRYDAQTTANIVWLRSPIRSASGVRCVYSSGNISYGDPRASAYRCCPVCKISLVK